MLLERDAALVRLGEELAAAAAGVGRVVLLPGEAGIGKSTLLEAFARRAVARILWGGCDALSTPHPLGPLHDVARHGAPSLGPLLAKGDRASLFDALLDELGNAPPVLLVLEDVHWADAATLDLVRFIGRRIHATPALMVLSYRDDELEGAPGLRATLGSLPARRVTRIPLPPLSPAAVDALAAGAGRQAAGLHALTGGNPFFVTEVLAHRSERLPESIRDAVLGRAATLDTAARAVLDFASLVPRAVETALCDAVIAPTPAAVHACIASGLLRAEGDTLRFRHELARVAVEETVAAPIAARLHAGALASLPSAAPGAGLARHVHHAQRAGDREAVLRLAPLAAREAAARGARHEAAAHCRVALRHAGHLPALERAALLDAFATHAFEANDLEGAIEARTEALALAAAVGDRGLECDLWARHAMPLVRALRNLDADAASHRAVALAERGLDDIHQARAYATESYLRMLNRDLDDAITWGRRAIALAERAGHPELLAAALNSTGAATMFADYDAGRALVRRGLEVARGLDDGGVRVADAYVMLGTAAGELRELEDAARDIEEGLAFTRTRDLDRLGGYMEAWQAKVLLDRGEWTAAGAVANGLLARETAGSTNRVMALVALGRLRVRRGDPGTDALLGEALQLAERSGTLQRIAPVRVMRAEAAWLAGDLEAAAREAEAAYALATAKRHAWFMGEAAFWLWRAGALAAPPAGIAPPYALQIAGGWRAAALAWRQRGCPYEEAFALADGDSDVQVAGLAILDRLEAQPLALWLRRRMRDAGECVPRGPRATTRENAAGLTTREMEVLRLVARGWRNGRIARELSRSPRTIEHHLEAILGKLDAGSRGEAVARARERGLLSEDR